MPSEFCLREERLFLSAAETSSDAFIKLLKRRKVVRLFKVHRWVGAVNAVSIS